MLSQDEMESRLSGSSSPGPPAKKRCLPNWRKVTKKLDTLFDLETYQKLYFDLYKVSNE